jgi:hypothetical protein
MGKGRGYTHYLVTTVLRGNAFHSASAEQREGGELDLSMRMQVGRQDWISVMDQREKLTDLVTSEYFFLIREFDFGLPQYDVKSYCTKIFYAGTGIGIELELDWHEFQFFSLVVRLEDGKLPNGYRVANDRKCRLYIRSLFHKGSGRPKKFKRAKTSGFSEESFVRAVVEERDFLLPHIDEILSRGQALFGDEVS